MQRRRILAGLTAVPLLYALQGCTPEAALTIGIHPWIGYEPLYLAQEFGWLGTSVSLLEGRIAGDSLSALKTRGIDGAALTLDEMLLARAEGVPLTIVAVFDASAGADMLLARPDIDSLEKLAGKRIGVERSALGATMLVKVLETAGLSRQAVRVLDVPPDQQLAVWSEGQVDAVVTYEPTASHILRAGARKLFDSRQMPDTIFDVLAVRQERLHTHERSLQALVGALLRGMDHMRVNRNDALHRTAARQHVSVEEARRALAGVTLPDLAGNRNYLRLGSPLDSAIRTLDTLMVQQGLLARSDSLDALFDPCFLPTANDL